MANFILDQKGRLLSTVFPTIRGDGAIGGQETMEITVDLSQIGSNNALTQLGQQSTLPNTNRGVAVNDTIDVAILPGNSIVNAFQLILDPNAPTPDVLPIGYSTAITSMTISVGTALVQMADRQSAVAVGTGATAYTASNTTFATTNQLVQTAPLGTCLMSFMNAGYALPSLTPITSGTIPTASVYVVRVLIAAITGATYCMGGKFRMRLGFTALGN